MRHRAANFVWNPVLRKMVKVPHPSVTVSITSNVGSKWSNDMIVIGGPRARRR